MRYLRSVETNHCPAQRCHPDAEILTAHEEEALVLDKQPNAKKFENDGQTVRVHRDPKETVCPLPALEGVMVHRDFRLVDSVDEGPADDVPGHEAAHVAAVAADR